MRTGLLSVVPVPCARLISANNLNKFLSILKKNTDNQIKINKKKYSLYEDKLYFDHDFLGNDIKDPFYLNINSNKVKIKFNEKLNSKIYEIIDKKHNVSIYYNFYTFNLTGYKESGKVLVKLIQLRTLVRNSI